MGWYVMISLAIISSLTSVSPEWGFYAHRKINKFAVYTLPDPLFSWYKDHIDYIELHAVDPDKRRYAIKHEGYFHYFDLDIYQDTALFEKSLGELKWKYSQVNVLSNDSIIWTKRVKEAQKLSFIPDSIMRSVLYDLNKLVPTRDVSYYWEDTNGNWQLHLADSFSIHGLLPYRILSMYNSLVQAFKIQDNDQILRLSAELGHYIGDAHVPLHTTENYNGQLTGQHGIHAFWESRLPELLLHQEHFLTIRPATYVSMLDDLVFSIIKESHSCVANVLDCEIETRKKLKQSQINCLDERNDRYVWTQCPDFARQFDQCLGNMVWDRWEKSIQNLGSLWYSAWADAGQPPLSESVRLNYIAGSEERDTSRIGKMTYRECEN